MRRKMAHNVADFMSSLETSSTSAVINQMAARKLDSERLDSKSEVGEVSDSSLGTAWPMSRQYSKWWTQSGHRREKWTKNVTSAEASLRMTKAMLPLVSDRTNQLMRLNSNCFASSSANVELSVLSLTMMVKAPKNLTWSLSRSNMPWANCHPAGERCKRCRASWVLTTMAGDAGEYKARTN